MDIYTIIISYIPFTIIVISKFQPNLVRYCLQKQSLLHEHQSTNTATGTNVHILSVILYSTATEPRHRRYNYQLCVLVISYTNICKLTHIPKCFGRPNF